MKKLIVHIGRAKTGTTAIQTCLEANRHRLNEQGYEYARTGLLYINHQPLAWTLIKKAFDQGNGAYWTHARRYAVLEKSPDAYWDDLREEIERSDFETFIISAEEFGVEWDLRATAPLLAEYVAGLDVDIVVYFRRQDDFLQSVYNEAVKGKETRFAGGFWDYVQPILNHGGADCLRIIEPWAAALGKQHVRVRVYEREQLPGGLLADFMQTVGLQLTDDFIKPVRVSNPPLQPWALEVMRRLNRYAVLQPLHGVFTDALRLLGSVRRAYADHQLLSAADRAELYARFAESNATVAREYLGRPDGRLFYAEPPRGGHG